MKTVRKLTILLLVLSMIFSVSVSASAAPASAATLQILYDGEPVLDVEPVAFEITANMTAKDAVDMFADVLEHTWTPSVFPGSSTTDYVIDTILGIGSEPVGADSGIPAVLWSATYPGYGLEYTEGTGDDAVYHYIYVGYEWSFAANGVVPENCTQVGYRFFPEYLLNRYTVQPGDSLEISYDLTIHRWTDTSFWLTN